MRKRFHSYQQIYSTDCGQSCVRMIARHHGLEIDYKYLCALADSDRQGLAVNEIVNLLDRIGFDAFAVNLDMKHVESMPLPAILFWNKNHYVVLYKIDLKKDVFHIADPALGKIKVKREDFISAFCDTEQNRGIAIVTDTKDSFAPDCFPKSHILKGLFSYVGDVIRGEISGLGKVTLMIDNGAIVEEGSHAELMEHQGRYAELVKNQISQQALSL